ncbi:MAG TPA: tannase/feruloyl esterase family alpha/beta hydrolase [Caulobacteraceae bacterium]|nr:tannase/feruloyl esterase family alpha/beta hydrolase [Caulobacteraceae bacterium]
MGARHIMGWVLAAGLWALAAQGAQAQSVDRCAQLKSASISGLSVTSAEAVSGQPSWSAPRQPSYNGTVSAPFCRVQGMIEGRIGIEVWLPPAARWNHRLLGAGVGGDAGVFNYTDMARGVQAGYAAASTDSGHKVSNLHWMLDPVAVEDYSQVAEHRMTEAAKSLVSVFYGQAVSHSYFLGCSGGGRQALKEAQVYPDDYDGVVAGAGGPDMPTLSARHMWESLFQKSHPAGAMSDADWAKVSAAAIEACDDADGVHDGVVENPAACRFDLSRLKCSTSSAGGCLSDDQLAVVRAIYSPLHDENGRTMDRGLFPGVRTRPGPPSPLLRAMFADGAYHDINWDQHSFRVGADLALANRLMPHLTTNNPDLKRFRAHGGKIILYQGWMDPSVIAQQSLDYYSAVQRANGGSKRTRQFARLFMVPGMFHCRGGAGPDSFGGSGDPQPVGDPDRDILSAAVRWVEEGHPPARLIAAKFEKGEAVRTRPLCPYPQTARFDGRGDPNKASSFTCVAAR